MTRELETVTTIQRIQRSYVGNHLEDNLIKEIIMNITAELVDYLAGLSWLEVQEGERQAMTAELERILAYMEVLNRLDTQGVEPMSHVFPVKNVLREDEVIPSQDRAELLAGSPAPDGEAFLVPKTVE